MKFFEVLQKISEAISKKYSSELVAPGEVASGEKNIKIMSSVLDLENPIRQNEPLKSETVQLTLVASANTKNGWDDLSGAKDVVIDFIKNNPITRVEVVNNSGIIKVDFLSDGNLLPALVINLKIFYK